MVKEHSKKYPEHWRGDYSAGKVLFACRLSKALLKGEDLLAVALDLAEQDEHYWVRVCARDLAIQITDMEKSGFANSRARESMAGRWCRREIDYDIFSPSDTALWFPYYDKPELDGILDIYRFKLKHLGQPGAWIPLKAIVLTSGEHPKGPLSDDQLEAEVGKAGKYLEDRNKRWQEPRKKIVPAKVSVDDVLRHCEQILRGGLKDERLEKPILGGDI
jgi:hypothetical protein